jgi:arsenate reductase
MLIDAICYASYMNDVLFVCHGNVMRSQMAEGFYTALAGAGHVAMSAGVDPLTQLNFSAPHPQAILVMCEVGIDISHQWVKLVTPTMVASSQLVIALMRQDLPPFLANTKKLEYWNIADPFNMPTAQIRMIRDTIHHRVSRLIHQHL